MTATVNQIVEWKKTILAALPTGDIAATLALSCILEELIKRDSKVEAYDKIAAMVLK